MVRGKNIDLPAGVELYVEIKTPIVVYGVRSSSDAPITSTPEVSNTPAENPNELSPDEMNLTPPTEKDSQVVQIEPTAQPQPAPTPPPAKSSGDGEIIEIFDEE